MDNNLLQSETKFRFFFAGNIKKKNKNNWKIFSHFRILNFVSSVKRALIRLKCCVKFKLVSLNNSATNYIITFIKYSTLPGSNAFYIFIETDIYTIFV